jgi:hypothetical protein
LHTRLLQSVSPELWRDLYGLDHPHHTAPSPTHSPPLRYFGVAVMGYLHAHNPSSTSQTYHKPLHSTVLHPHYPPPSHPPPLRRYFDKTGTGYLRVEDLRRILHNLELGLPHRAIKALVAAVADPHGGFRGERVYYRWGGLFEGGGVGGVGGRGGLVEGGAVCLTHTALTGASACTTGGCCGGEGVGGCLGGCFQCVGSLQYFLTVLAACPVLPCVYHHPCRDLSTADVCVYVR